jgi:hypothetical protein
LFLSTQSLIHSANVSIASFFVVYPNAAALSSLVVDKATLQVSRRLAQLDLPGEDRCNMTLV